MSFRNKLALSFISILILAIAVAVTSWWGMDTALRQQTRIFSFTLDIDRLFSTLLHEQHALIVSQESSRTIEIRKLLDDLETTIASATSSPDRAPAQPAAAVLTSLKKYKDYFLQYSSNLLDMQTMQSRMLLESDRLFATTRSSSATDIGSNPALIQEVSAMFLAEKNYTLTDDEQAGLQVLKTIGRIEELASLTGNTYPEGSEALKSYRTLKIASVYRDVFEKYMLERHALIQKLEQLNASRIYLSLELSRYLDGERENTRKKVTRVKLLTLAVSLVAIILSILVTALLASRITRPINELKNSATAIIEGNLDTQVPLTTNDEIGQLADIFNQMTRKLKQSFEELQTYRNDLEQLVTTRTSELQKEIEERRQVEADLKTGEEQLHLIIDQSPMGIIFWDTQFHVRRWNTAAEMIFGYTAEEAKGLPAHQLLPASMHKHMEKIWYKMTSAAEGVRSRNENLTRGGRTIQCDWFNTAIVDTSGNVLGALSLVENVTERMRLEKELLKLEKLESTGLLAGGIAHDFNNILTGILGNINLAQLSDDLPSKTRNLLLAAEKASVRAKSLTQQLLTFAKGGEPIREATSLIEVIHDSASFVLHGGNVSPIFRLDDDLRHALVDRNQFSQVIQNIVLNARHAMPQGGVITIEGKNVSPGENTFPLLNPDSRYLKISIRDEGIGIPNALLDKIFDPYFSTKQEGSGLGLAITLSIIRKHDGHIQVTSEPGKGTEFVIYLPATIDKEIIATETKKMASIPDNIEVLIMEDDPGVQTVLKAMLGTLGYQVTVTSSGEEAITHYRERLHQGKAFDLIIVDLTIAGGMGGKETLAALQHLDPQVRAIVSSGYCNDPVMASYKEHGFRTAMTKPYVLEELEKAIALAFSSDDPS